MRGSEERASTAFSSLALTPDKDLTSEVTPITVFRIEITLSGLANTVGAAEGVDYLKEGMGERC